MHAARKQGAIYALVGLLAAGAAFGFVRLQSGSGRILVPFATVVGTVFFAIGFFHLIVGPHKSKIALRVLAVVFASIVGLVGSFFGFTWAMRATSAPASVPVDRAVERQSRELEDIERGLEHRTTSPGAAGDAARAADTPEAPRHDPAR
jgi:hypothetical protein